MYACRVVLIALVVSLSMFGCHMNANYCEGRNPDNNCLEPVSDASMPNMSCPDQITCSGAKGVCNTDTGKCVMCTADHHEICTGPTPACGTDNTCQACTAHNQCAASNVCLPDGTCGDSNDVAYVQEGVSPGTVCTKAKPCPLLSNALGTKRSYIKVSGTIRENITVKDAQVVTILADPGAKLGPKNNDILLELKGGSNLTVYDLELFGALGSAGHAISMPPGNQSTLSLYRVKILNNTGAGITADGGTLNVSQSTIAKNDGGGIIMNSAMTFQIFNNFFIGNGTPGNSGTSVGAINAVPAAGSTLDFNTFVGNKANDQNSLAASGVICGPKTFLANGNLFYGNTNPTFLGGCDFQNSFVSTTDPHFVDAANNDYHLTASSSNAIVDNATCLSTVTTDFDGDPRPQGAKCDFGADEYRP